MAVKTKRPSGMSMASLLVLVGLLAVLATSMVALFTTNLNLLQASNNGQLALSEAEAGLNQVLLNLACDPDYGTHNESFRRSLQSGFSPQECYHEVSFDTGQSQVPWSLNARSGSATGYGGRPVASETVHVISTGYCRGQVRTLEAIVRQPPFNYALACAGPIHSANPLRVEGIDSRQAYVQGSSKPLPGHIVSNSPQGIQVSALSGVSSYISGQARSSGSVDLDPQATVLGGKRPQAAALPLPSINVASFDPVGTPGLQSHTSATESLQTVSATHRCPQDTTFSQPVDFQSGLMYVSGNAVFEHGLSGSGALIVDGDLTIRGAGTQLVGTSSVAILASGRITIEGDPNQTVTPTVSANFINGLVYGAKGVDLSNITVAGIVLTDDPQAASQFANTNLMYVADAASLSINIAPQVDSGSSDGPPIFYGSLDANGNFVPSDPAQANGQLFIGIPPGAGPEVWQHAVTNPPGNQSISDFVSANLNTAYLGSLRHQAAGLDLAVPGTPANRIVHLANGPLMPANPADTHFPATGNNPPMPRSQLRDEILASFSSSTSETSGWTVTNPGSTFKLDLNNFLPRSSTLRVSALCVHSSRL